MTKKNATEETVVVPNSAQSPVTSEAPKVAPTKKTNNGPAKKKTNPNQNQNQKSK